MRFYLLIVLAVALAGAVRWWPMCVWCSRDAMRLRRHNGHWFRFCRRCATGFDFTYRQTMRGPRARLENLRGGK